MCKVLLIIPAYNESEGIVNVIETVKTYIGKTSYDLDYIVINDGSTDNEEEVLRIHNINHIELVQNLGIGGAVQTGYRYALVNNYDIVVQFDGDGQHDIESLPMLIDPLINEEVDFVVGSRFLEDSPSTFKSSLPRRMGSKWLSFMVKLVSNISIKDITSGYRAANRKVVIQFSERYPSKYPEPESYVHLVKKGIHIKEVGVLMFERSSGKSSINPFAAIHYMLNVTIAILLSGWIEKEK